MATGADVGCEKRCHQLRPDQSAMVADGDQPGDAGQAGLFSAIVGPVTEAFRAIGAGTVPHEGAAAADAALTATWFLPPERHAAELLLVTPALACVTYFVVRSNKRRQHPDPDTCKPYPLYWKVGMAVLLVLTWYYKWTREATLYALMPCHIFNLIGFIVTIVPYTSWRRRLLSLMLSWQALPMCTLAPAATLAALRCVSPSWPADATLLPDTRGLEDVDEIVFYWIQHAVAISFPFHAIATGRAHPVDNVRYAFLAWGIGTIFYMTVGTWLGLFFGNNLNFMLSPPAGFENAGQNFRLIIVCLLVVMLSVGRLMALGYHALLKAVGVELPPPRMSDGESAGGADGGKDKHE